MGIEMEKAARLPDPMVRNEQYYKEALKKIVMMRAFYLDDHPDYRIQVGADIAEYINEERQRFHIRIFRHFVESAYHIPVYRHVRTDDVYSSREWQLDFAGGGLSGTDCRSCVMVVTIDMGGKQSEEQIQCERYMAD